MMPRTPVVSLSACTRTRPGTMAGTGSGAVPGPRAPDWSRTRSGTSNVARLHRRPHPPLHHLPELWTHVRIPVSMTIVAILPQRTPLPRPTVRAALPVQASIGAGRLAIVRGRTRADASRVISRVLRQGNATLKRAGSAVQMYGSQEPLVAPIQTAPMIRNVEWTTSACRSPARRASKHRTISVLPGWAVNAARRNGSKLQTAASTMTAPIPRRIVQRISVSFSHAFHVRSP